MAAGANIRGLNCPNCGAALAIRGFEHTLNVVCINCLSVLDAKDPNFRVLETFHAKERLRPLIPLGSRGKLHGDAYEVIGFQERTIYVDLMPYAWQEYLLFNPFKGFRYLTYFDGHWNDVKTVHAVPEWTTAKGKKAVRLLGRTYVHFQSATAETTYVMGEFPYRVHVGGQVQVQDFISPPYILSMEGTGSDTTWSLGEYTAGAKIWEVFKLPGSPPAPAGIFANQPSPFEGRVKSMWVAFLVLILLLGNLALFFSNFAGQEEVFSRHYSYSPNAPGEKSLVTPVFELKGRPSNVELSVRTDLSNNWAYFNFALINEETGQAYDFGREISYYFGRDSDGAWTEGRPGDTVIIPTVPPGRYYLRVEPEMDPNSQARYKLQGMAYQIRVRRDVPVYSFYWLAAVLLLIPPGFHTFRSIGFEKARWQESDYASASGDDE